MSDEDHYLDSYLSEILPALGLDAETYAPYVTGYANENDDGDDGESLDELMELLQASSESHADDDAAWANLRKEIIQRRDDYVSGESARKELQALEIQATTHANLQKEIDLAQKNAVEVEARKQMELESNKLENMSKDKIALMAMYGYEDGNDNNETQNDGESDKPVTNRDVAAAMNRQNTQKQKSVQTQTKQEARQETKKAKADKMAKKEERRKKAGKKERRA
mmetsp:Transcript_12356/g.22303  ORF Transcript_12356/g.22303 Transcript_12356/m.22303 type:complete len:224 (-) Transcript_12356:73-744(-)|eukprot:CAMPEP_0196145278 /NCGR_PEP_ID=MMETSP0910-20130528/19799_1 /TAXON_ID=49265 /ORGANISM="Thalassiosira rotula, Strain GSO102" /LENGTH=223 /DNA_ID=CAMNT_0041407193 /DNA_START=7 /DNA_END=678 /DNA_ORIENTATION=+